MTPRRLERRRSQRRDHPADHGFVRARVRPGHDATLVNVSEGGALLETTRRLLPGVTLELQLHGSDGAVLAVRGRVLRASVARVRATAVTYRGALAFEHKLSANQTPIGRDHGNLLPRI